MTVKGIRPGFFSFLARCTAAAAFYIANTFLIYGHEKTAKFLHLYELESLILLHAVYVILLGLAVFAVMTVTKHGAVHFGISYLIIGACYLLFPKHYSKLDGASEFFTVPILIYIEMIFLGIALRFSSRVKLVRLIDLASENASAEVIPYIKSALENTEGCIREIEKNEAGAVIGRFSPYLAEHKTKQLTQQLENVSKLIQSQIDVFDLEDFAASEYSADEKGEPESFVCFPRYSVKTVENKKLTVTFRCVCIQKGCGDRIGIEGIRVEERKTGAFEDIGEP